MAAERIYLDNAATTWPKPEPVYVAVEQAMRDNGASVGRGVFADAMAAARVLKSARSTIAKYIGAADDRSVVFTSSGTDSLSTAILGLLRPTDHAVTTAADHNSVLRPLKHLEATIGVEVSTVACDETGRVDAADVLAAIRPNTRLLVMTHASNVTGAVQPIAEAFAESKKKAARLVTLLDAAQTLGHLPVDINDLSCDMLAAPGHKGLYGPLGTGILYLHSSVSGDVAPLRLGGTGVSGGQLDQPSTLPEKYEAGNLNLPAIAGLKAGVDYLNSPAGQASQANLLRCSDHLLKRLQAIDGVRLYVPEVIEFGLGLFSFEVLGIDSHSVAAMLDGMGCIQVRSGLHCAPLLHQKLGTDPMGTVRVSLGAFNTIDQIDTACDAIQAIAAGF